MIQEVYLIAEPGADRVYVSGHLPESYVRQHPNARIYRIQVELPCIQKIDGELKMIAEPVAEEIRLPKRR